MDDDDDYDEEEREGMNINKSFIEFGEIDPTIISTGSLADITWMKSTSRDTWSNTIRGIKFGNGEVSEDVEFAVEPYEAWTFTGGQCIFGPEKYIVQLREMLADTLLHYET